MPKGILPPRRMILKIDDSTTLAYKIRAITGKITYVEKDVEHKSTFTGSRIYGYDIAFGTEPGTKNDRRKGTGKIAVINNKNLPNAPRFIGHTTKMTDVPEIGDRATVYVAECMPSLLAQERAVIFKKDPQNGYTWFMMNFATIGLKLNGNLVFMKNNERWQKEFDEACESWPLAVRTNTFPDKIRC